jgi:hypothetical protein
MRVPLSRRGRRPALLAAVAAVAAVAVGLTLAVPAGSSEIGFTRVVDIDAGDGMRLTANIDDWSDQVVFQHRDNGARIGFAEFVDTCERNPYECQLEVQGILEDATWSMSRAAGLCPGVDGSTGRTLLADYPDGWMTAQIVKAAAIGGTVSLVWNYAVNELGQVSMKAGTAFVYFTIGLLLDSLNQRYLIDPGRYGPLERAVIALLGNAVWWIGQVVQQRWNNGMCPDISGFGLARQNLPVVQDIEMGVIRGPGN